MTVLIVTNARVGDSTGCRVVIENGTVTEIRRAVPVTTTTATAKRSHVRIIDGQGGSLVPGLWDHHAHLYASAARRRSISVTTVSNPAEFSSRVRAAIEAVPAGDWLRVVGYDDSSLGELSGPRLEGLAPTDIPIKVQHRSGHQWVVNTAGRRRLEAAGARVGPDGILWDNDAAFRDSSTDRSALLQAVALEARALAAAGCVGVTDMTATSSKSDVAELQGAVGHIIRLESYGREDGGLNNAKIIVTDYEYPDPAHLVARLTNPRFARVAVHAVSVEALALIGSAEQLLGERVRVEHAFLVDDDLIDLMAAHGVQIGVHPGFLYTQGDRLRRVLTTDEQMGYQRLASLRDRGLRLFGGTDRPFSTPDVWRCMEAAVTRRTASGDVLSPGEALTPEDAFALFTPAGLSGEAGEPVVREGDPADVCLLDRSWAQAREHLALTTVALTVNVGRVMANRNSL